MKINRRDRHARRMNDLQNHRQDTYTITELRREFNRVLRAQGMKAALAWREARLDPDA